MRPSNLFDKYAFIFYFQINKVIPFSTVISLNNFIQICWGIHIPIVNLHENRVKSRVFSEDPTGIVNQVLLFDKYAFIFYFQINKVTPFSTGISLNTFIQICCGIHIPFQTFMNTGSNPGFFLKTRPESLLKWSCLINMHLFSICK